MMAQPVITLNGTAVPVLPTTIEREDLTFGERKANGVWSTARVGDAASARAWPLETDRTRMTQEQGRDLVALLTQPGTIEAGGYLAGASGPVAVRAEGVSLGDGPGADMRSVQFRLVEVDPNA